MVIRDDRSALGQFVYPPVDNTLTFNYRDTINVSWITTFDAHSLCFLTLWYWPEAEPWTLSMYSVQTTCIKSTQALKVWCLDTEQ